MKIKPRQTETNQDIILYAIETCDECNRVLAQQEYITGKVKVFEQYVCANGKQLCMKCAERLGV